MKQRFTPAERAEIVKRLMAIDEEATKGHRILKKGLSEQNSAHLDVGDHFDGAASMSQASVDTTVADQHYIVSRQAKKALEDLDKGTYGICERCDEEIALPRLKAVPFATRCRSCQEYQEEYQSLDV